MNAIEAANAGDIGGICHRLERCGILPRLLAKAFWISIPLKMIVDGIGTSVDRSQDAVQRLEAIMQYAEHNVMIAKQLQVSMVEQEAGTGMILASMNELQRITEEVNASINAQKDAILEFSKSLNALEAISSRGQ
jgi:hypothetical protein